MRTISLSACLLLAACANAPSSESPASSSPVPAPSATDRPAPASAAQQASAAPVVSATPVAPSVDSAAPSASVAVGEAPPDVDVKNIGMHIGGGPNDNETKAPIKTSVEPHFDAIKRCYAKADEPKQGDVSLDLKIPKAGGKAELQKYKSGIPGDAFKTCISDLFKEIEFKKPKTGTTIVSYSLRFTPGKKK